jgi:UDP-N-acetylglucosamine diphosphorylase / glucose-1-phosphate thymidylyltransferase / UDP-N-acetylgalactosamine diphosphorylase / glucosamine-1-phosphate N-acetyltransferase / galactosamine-1-phosphate N-acetyltransferase
MNLCIFEDDTFSNFYPLTHLRPTFQLRVGLYTLDERLIRTLQPQNVRYICRKNLNPTLREGGFEPVTSAFRVEQRMLFVNGLVIDAYTLADQLPLNDNEDFIALHGERLIAAQLSPDHAREFTYYLLDQDITEILRHLASQVRCIQVETDIATYPWDFIARNPAMIETDIAHLPDRGIYGDVHPQAVLYNTAAIHIDAGAQIDAMAVIDARDGPIRIAADVHVQPFSYIQGPTSIGRDTMIVGGQIREGTTIGPVCRVGGEVEESIIQGYSNKYHAGFLGHSYLGEWVNIGAIATNSDLKNTYSNIRMEVNNIMLDTGSQKMGVVLGDHVKLGIGVMLVGGATVGIASNIMNGLAPKVMPSFVWSDGSNYTEYNLDKFLSVARRAMRRRKIEMTTAQANLIRHVFYLTRQQRAPDYRSQVI